MTTTTTVSANSRQRYGALDSVDATATTSQSGLRHRHLYPDSTHDMSHTSIPGADRFGPEVALLTVVLGTKSSPIQDNFRLVLQDNGGSSPYPFYYVDWDDGNGVQFYENTGTTGNNVYSPNYDADGSTKKVLVWGGNVPSGATYDFIYYDTTSLSGTVTLTRIGGNSGFTTSNANSGY